MPANPFDRRPSDIDRATINRRANAYLARAAEEAYQADLARWARDDSAPFPDRAAIRSRLEAELRVLCSGLGTWAAADPAEFFSRIDKDARRAPWEVENWDDFGEAD